MITAEFKQEINDLVTENLYQWDTYQMLKISGIDFGTIAPKVHFANKKSTEALAVNAILQDDGSVKVSIPNSLLTEKYNIVAYIYTNTGLTSKTIKSITIPIIPRLKPSEYYQPSDEDIAQIEAIELEAKAIIDGLTASVYDSTEKYKRPNIVYFGCDSYMCKSGVEISGIDPTDTTKWQRLTNIVEAIKNDAEELEPIIGETTDTVDFNTFVKKDEISSVKLDIDSQGRVVYSKVISVQNNGILVTGETKTTLETKITDVELNYGDILLCNGETLEVVENGACDKPYYALKVINGSSLISLSNFNASLVVSVLPQKKKIKYSGTTLIREISSSSINKSVPITFTDSILNKILEVEYSIGVTNSTNGYPTITTRKFKKFKCTSYPSSHMRDYVLLEEDSLGEVVLIRVSLDIVDANTLNLWLTMAQGYACTVAIHSISEVIE